MVRPQPPPAPPLTADAAGGRAEKAADGCPGNTEVATGEWRGRSGYKTPDGRPPGRPADWRTG